MNYAAELRLGNQVVFEELYNKYHQRFYFYVLKNTSSNTLAEEVIQISFIKIWENRTRLSDDFPVEVQIARTVRSIMIDTLRKRASERKALNIIIQNTDTTVINDPIVGKQLNQQVTEAIDSLPTECRKVFILSREEGLTYNEIADSLSISPKTVESQISKALKIVKKAAALFVTLMLYYQIVTT